MTEATDKLEARRLDRILGQAPTVAASAILRERIIQAAPRPRARAWRWLTGFTLGAGLAAACAAGVVAGFLVAPSQISASLDPAEDATALLREPPDLSEG